ncbi:tripartite motif-containing protein 30A isoform X2 [Cricetulus griseus]|uniref:tripartite motif-containing protein 30A isoform X2 n=1 Tax=Cricetulus griseus TaxID=10029 RepID=UPI0015C38023|nr:tripartite motif-containing protein 30A isoform X2 [Cricetulus griseus]
MASSVLMKIKEEVTCPICLELLREPVIADCDHSFCRDCITLNYESSKGKEEEGICPVCRVTYMFGHLRPNQHVANIVERITEFKSSPEEEQKVNVCAQHGEKLQLFCEKDMVAICWLCERSQNHRGHQTALIEEVAHKYKGVNSVLTRIQTLRVKLPKIIPRKQRSIFRAPDVKGMLQVYQGLMDAQRYWVHVTLRQVHNKNVDINMEKRQIQCQYSCRRNLQDYETYDLGVLGIPAMQSGKHYWEVDVSRSDAWLLGLNDGRCAQPQLHSKNQKGIMHSSHDEQHVNFQPKYGYWVIGKKNKSIYNAFVECSVTHNASVLVLSLTRPPSRVGVFLDREACTLSFYDVSNHGALIYKFYEPSFPHTVYPYFNPMESLQPMTVCRPPS